MKNKIRVDTQLLLLHSEIGFQGPGGRENLGNMTQTQRTTKSSTTPKPKAVLNKTSQVLETLSKFFKLIDKTGTVSCQPGAAWAACP